MILLIDNYDSFVFNLARYFAELGCRTEVVRNNACDISGLSALNPMAIVLSPGPCTPRESGICLDVVRELGPRVPILGVCLGHQAIAHALGGTIVRATELMHGRTSRIHHDGGPLFTGLPNPFSATRYHSLIVDESSLPDELTVTARTADGIVMGLQHRNWPVAGVQFHPESILTPDGRRLLGNFLTLAGISWRLPASDELAKNSDADDFYRREVLRDHPYPGDYSPSPDDARPL